MRHTIRIEVDLDSDCPEVRRRLAIHGNRIAREVKAQIFEAIHVGWPEDEYGSGEYRDPEIAAVRMQVRGPADTFHGT